MAEEGKLHLIQLAGGKGQRVGDTSRDPKQFRETGRGPLFAVSLREFLKLEPADLVVVVPDDWMDRTTAVLQKLGLPFALAAAGASRTASTWHGLQVLEDKFHPGDQDLVAIHDAARPFASADLLKRLCQAAAKCGGAIPGVPVHDTIVENGSAVARYLERGKLAAVQTPQVFRWDILREAHVHAASTGAEFTDDGGLLAARGAVPAVVPGEAGNWKVTTAEDWRQAATLLSRHTR